MGLVGGVIGVLAAWGIDAIANRLAYRFILKPHGASFVDFFYLPLWLSIGAILFALVRFDPCRALSGGARRAHRSGASADGTISGGPLISDG